MSNLTGFAFEAQRSKQVVYRTADGHIHELSVVLGGSSNWSHADLSGIAGGPPAALEYIGFAFEAQRSKQVVYRTADGHIHELSVVLGGSSWSYADLSGIAGGPPAESLEAAFAFEAQRSKQVVYRTADGHIHELSVVLGGGNWSHADLSEIAGGPPAA
jgi:predicted NUDIX family NTP pyrophosphohydrolase